MSTIEAGRHFLLVDHTTLPTVTRNHASYRSPARFRSIVQRGVVSSDGTRLGSRTPDLGACSVGTRSHQKRCRLVSLCLWQATRPTGNATARPACYTIETTAVASSRVRLPDRRHAIFERQSAALPIAWSQRVLARATMGEDTDDRSEQRYERAPLRRAACPRKRAATSRQKRFVRGACLQTKGVHGALQGGRADSMNGCAHHH